jgi:hypothetical protein
MTKHKHTSVLSDYLNNTSLVLQWRFTTDHRWFDLTLGKNSITPLSDPDLEWRIKPELKPDVISYVNIYKNMGYDNLEEAHYSGVPSSKGVIKVVLDGETQELKSVEII